MDIIKIIRERQSYKMDDTFLVECIKNPIKALKEITTDEEKFPIFFGILKRLWDGLFIKLEMLSIHERYILTEFKLTQALQIATPKYFGTLDFIMDMAKIKPKDIKNIEFDCDTFLVMFTLYDYYKMMMSQKETQKKVVNHYYE